MSKVNIKFRYNDQHPVEVKKTTPGPLVLDNLLDSYISPQYIDIQQRISPVKSSSLEKSPRPQPERNGSQTLLQNSKNSHVLIAEEPSPHELLNERPVVQEVVQSDLIGHTNQKKVQKVKPDAFSELISKKDIPKREQPKQELPKKEQPAEQIEQPKQKIETSFPVPPKPADANHKNQKVQYPIEINPLIMPVGAQKNEPSKKLKKQQLKVAYQYNGIPTPDDEPKGGCCSWCGNCNCKKTQKVYPIRQ